MCQTTIQGRIAEVQKLLAEAKQAQGGEIVGKITSAEVILQKIVNEGQVLAEEAGNCEEEKEEEAGEESAQE